MPQRSDQAVASRGSQPAAGEPPPPPGRLLIGWATALAALGVSTTLLAAGLWFVRFPLAEFIIGAALAERGVEADFEVVRLDFGGATLSGVTFGAEATPDASAASVEAAWDWQGLVPRLRRVRLLEPQLRLRLDQEGRLSAGSLDRVGDRPGQRRPALPAIELEIVDGQALVQAPFGVLTAELSSAGRIGHDFHALALVREFSSENGAYALDQGAGQLELTSADNALRFELNATLAALRWQDARVADAVLRAAGEIPTDLSRYRIEAIWRAASIDGAGFSARELVGEARGSGVAREDAIMPASWRGQARIAAAQAEASDIALAQPRLAARADANNGEGAVHWTLDAAGASSPALVSADPGAAGTLSFGAGGLQSLRGGATIALARAQLTPETRRRVRGMFPELNGAPVGPQFAQARRALDAAASAFDLSLPLRLDHDGQGLRIALASPATARAASGASVRLAALRQDSPGPVLQWPGPALHGAVALELEGGGAPSASLLLDTVSWTPAAAFDADGTLTLANWRSEGADISARELGVTISATAESGRVDLRGPLHLTGPIGDGALRDLEAALNLTLAWRDGWRVTANDDCVRMRVGALEAAGLAFSDGALALCPLNGALIAANARGALSGGFSIQRLALNGRMAGPDAQPARLSADNVVGRFSGRIGDLTLAIEADRPRLAVDMEESRTLAVALARVTADATIADTWGIQGAFERGTLSDPALPGSVSTIEGAWQAAPEDGKPVIRVTAGEALLTANRPEDESERALFNPLRLVNVSGSLRGGRILADGAIVLEDGARQLAAFTASHEIRDGVGRAEVHAEQIVFGDALQPFEITEQARGMVENVRGPVGVTADIAWDRSAIAATGRLRLDGVSLATSTIPIVNDVRGEIAFDDLFQLTTPPGQSVTVALVNPGIAVRDGRVRFQLLSDQRISIEQAEFNFAAGTLAMSPTTVRLGEDETTIELTLRDVDAAALVANLNLPDLSVTGRVEGSFPIRLTRRTAFIENGVLRALPGGGALAYTGQAGADVSGPAEIAFDALRSFHYDELSLTLDGDISGDVVSTVQFSGRNTGRDVDLGDITPVPGIGDVTVRGVPFNFHVTVTAPFRRLAQTAATFTDPASMLDQARQAGPSQPPQVDPETPRQE